MERNLKTAIKAAIEAGEAILKIYDTDFSVALKDDASPLTIADEESNNVINKYLLTTGIPIISEENKQTDYDERKDWEQCWIVDPLDGTKEFVKRNGEFTVNIALVKQGVPVMGVIYVPVSGWLYFTNEKGTGSFKLQIKENSIPENIMEEAIPLTPAKLSEPVKVVGSRSHLNESTEAYIHKLEEKYEVEIVSKGSSLKFCLVAEGDAHVYPRFAPTMEWDTAAGQAICSAVGVSVINQETQKPLRYNRENLLNPHFLVSAI